MQITKLGKKIGFCNCFLIVLVVNFCRRKFELKICAWFVHERYFRSPCWQQVMLLSEVGFVTTSARRSKAFSSKTRFNKPRTFTLYFRYRQPLYILILLPIACDSSRTNARERICHETMYRFIILTSIYLRFLRVQFPQTRYTFSVLFFIIYNISGWKICNKHNFIITKNE